MTWMLLNIDGLSPTYQYNAGGDVRNANTGRQLKPCIANHGYYVYYLGKRGSRAVVLKHRLIAMANIPNPLNKPHVNHIDGDKTNNAVANLEWVTHQENMAHAYRTGLAKAPKIGPGTESRAAKLNDEKVRAIRQRIANGERQRDIAASYGLAPSTISWIGRRKTWAHI